jgi:predicted enzyme related to lactoylglutathione lyase
LQAQSAENLDMVTRTRPPVAMRSAPVYAARSLAAGAAFPGDGRAGLRRSIQKFGRVAEPEKLNACAMKRTTPCLGVRLQASMFQPGLFRRPDHTLRRRGPGPPRSHPVSQEFRSAGRSAELGARRREIFMSRITHFEIHASDPTKLMSFYSALFAWKFQKWGEIDYWLVETGPSDQPGINGGLLPRPKCEGKDSQWVNAYVCTASVKSLDDALAKALSLGAITALPKMPVPGVGWLAYIKDPDGNILGMMQPDANAK